MTNEVITFPVTRREAKTGIAPLAVEIGEADAAELRG